MTQYLSPGIFIIKNSTMTSKIILLMKNTVFGKKMSLIYMIQSLHMNQNGQVSLFNGCQIKISIYFYLRNSEYSIHKLIIGTHTDNTEPNYLMIAKVKINLLGPNSE